MTDPQRAKLMRGEKVKVFLADNAAELTPLANVGTFHQELEDKIIETNGNDIIATADTTGVTETKNDESTEMVASSLKLSSFLKIYADAIGNKTLFNQIDFKRSELTGKDDNARRNAGRYLAEQGAIPAIATAMAALAPAYTAGDLTAHIQNVTEYDLLIGRPNEERSNKSAYTKAVARNMIELDDIIARLRTQMGIVEFSNLLLFEKFEAAALIDDAPSHSNTHYSGTIDPNGQKKITVIVYDATDELNIKNTGTTTFQLSFRNAGGDVFGTPVDVDSGATLQLTYEQIAPEGTDLWLKNMSALQAASFDLQLI